jgi:hypothetical protein
MLAMRMLGPAALALAFVLIAPGGAPAEIVARGIHDGTLALDPGGKPYVAYTRGRSLIVTKRVAPGRWRAERADSFSLGSQVMAFEVGAAGPVVLVLNADSRRLTLVREGLLGWQSTVLNSRLSARGFLGWPGLALGHGGLPLIAYTRWNAVSYKSQLLLTRVDVSGRLRTTRITAEGFPQSYVPPPAEPVIVGGRVHVLESYGYRGTVATLEWFPQKRTWLGLGIDAGLGDFPIGPVFGGIGPDGYLHAAWTESLIPLGTAPVTLATRGRVSDSKFVLERALTTGLALPGSGAEVAANEWVAPDDIGLTGPKFLWAGTIVKRTSRVELDGWLAGLAVAPRGGRDVLLGGASGLNWFHSPRRLTTHVTIEAVDQGDGTVAIDGRVGGVASGKVTLYRERPSEPRVQIARLTLSDGEFSFVDTPPVRPVLYRAVYTDPATGIPFAALLRTPIVDAGSGGGG